MEAKCEQDIDLCSEEEDFINSCRDLDALAPDYDKKAAALFDTIQNAVSLARLLACFGFCFDVVPQVEANGRLFYMVVSSMKCPIVQVYL